MVRPLYIFCFQAYNDIDHMVPVVDRLSRERPDVDIACVIFAVNTRFADDFRIRHLIALGINVSHVIDHLQGSPKPWWLEVYFSLQKKANTDRTPRFARRVLRFLGWPLERKRAVLMARFEAETFLASVSAGRTVKAVLYDHSPSLPWYSAMSILGRKQGFFTAALPHAVDNWDNALQTVNDLEPFPGKKRWVYQCDSVVAPDQRNLEQMIESGFVTDGQGVVLGSPRFCDEWVAKIRTLAPPCPMPSVPEGAYKIVLMMCRPHLNIFEEEVLRIITFISRIPNVEVVVKLHTRNHMLGQSLPSNVHKVENNIPSHDLIDWADLTLFSATSVILDSLKLDKPVLYLRRTVANKLVFERYIQSWNVDCRDDLRDIIVSLRDGVVERTYTQEERDNILTALVEPKGRDVLGNYVNHIIENAEAAR